MQLVRHITSGFNPIIVKTPIGVVSLARMATTSESLAFDRGVRPMLEIVLPAKADAVIGFQADPDLQARIEELARKSTEGELTEDERAEIRGLRAGEQVRRHSQTTSAADRQLTS